MHYTGNACKHIFRSQTNDIVIVSTQNTFQMNGVFNTWNTLNNQNILQKTWLVFSTYIYWNSCCNIFCQNFFFHHFYNFWITLLFSNLILNNSISLVDQSCWKTYTCTGIYNNWLTVMYMISLSIKTRFFGVSLG